MRMMERGEQMESRVPIGERERESRVPPPSSHQGLPSMEARWEAESEGAEGEEGVNE